MGKYAAAIKSTRESLALDTDNSYMAGEIGTNYLLVDMVEEARRWFDLEAEIDPESPWVLVDSLLLNYYLQQNEEETFRLAREFLTEIYICSSSLQKPGQA